MQSGDEDINFGTREKSAIGCRSVAALHCVWLKINYLDAVSSCTTSQQ